MFFSDFLHSQYAESARIISQSSILVLVLFCLRTDSMNWLDTMQFKGDAMEGANG
jgi:hypothetical protein